MNDDKKVLEEVLRLHEDTNNRITKALNYFLIAFVVSIFLFCTTIATVVISTNEMIKDSVHTYFETDYGYGTIEQNTDVKVGEK